jgi:hypothetical protein
MAGPGPGLGLLSPGQSKQKIQRRLEPNAVSDLNLRRPYFVRPFIHVGDHVVVLTGR